MPSPKSKQQKALEAKAKQSKTHPGQNSSEKKSEVSGSNKILSGNQIPKPRK
jgi:hypothetical protein